MGEFVYLKHFAKSMEGEQKPPAYTIEMVDENLLPSNVYAMLLGMADEFPTGEVLEAARDKLVVEYRAYFRHPKKAKLQTPIKQFVAMAKKCPNSGNKIGVTEDCIAFWTYDPTRYIS